jgi:putative flippase GtrA
VKVKAKTSENLQPGLVFMTFHFKEAAANLLTINLGIYDLISVLIAIVVAMLWNFLLNNWWTWPSKFLPPTAS